MITLPFGYEQFRLDNGISHRTLHSEVQLIEHFLSYINSVYKTHVEPHDIKPIDVKNFLAERKKHGIKGNTLKKDLSYLRQFFDYLWKTNKISSDFTSKMTIEIKTEKTDVTIDYEYLLSIYDDVLRNAHILFKAKVLFILYMRGWRFRDIREIRIEQLKDDGTKITLRFPNQYNMTVVETFTGLEVAPFLSCMNESIFRGSPYLLSSKIKDSFEQFSIYSSKDYLLSISKYYSLPFTLHNSKLKFAYVHHLYTVKQYQVEKISELLGIPLPAAANLIKESLERVKIVDYNSKRTS